MIYNKRKRFLYLGVKKMVVTLMKYFYLFVALFCLLSGILVGFAKELPLSVIVIFLGFFNLALYYVFHREALKKQQI